LIAFGVGYVVIAWFLQYIATHTFTPFVAYRVVLGVAIITLVAAGVLAPGTYGQSV
jgi:undecaprenyl-diphosphatase